MDLLRVGRSPFALAALLVALLMPATASAQSFEQLIENLLGRQREEPSAPTEPLPPTGSEVFPSDPDLNPVELGPRPYTPPKIDPPIVEPPKPAQGGASGAGAASGGGEAAAGGGATTGGGTTTGGGATSAAAPATATPEQPAEAPAQLPIATETQDAPLLTPDGERTRESLQVAEVNAVTFSQEALAVRGANPLVLKTQVLLDRAGASPGAIDGYAGGNLSKAIAAVEMALSLVADGELDAEVWEALRGDSSGDVLVQYTITEQDLGYPFTPDIPDDYSQAARLQSLAFSGPAEMLAERFHIDERLLRALNPGADFAAAGTTIWITSVEAQPVRGQAARIIADKTRKQLRAYDGQNRLIVAYPAMIGSSDNPSPFGEHRVEAVTSNPVFYYEPGSLASAGDSTTLTLAPGPNNPLGTTWIELSAPACGIHGTPLPTKVTKIAARGCVRLTNWDVEELAELVAPGVTVSFVD